MSFRDIFGLILSIGIYILPFALVICFVLSLIYSHYKDTKKTKAGQLGKDGVNNYGVLEDHRRESNHPANRNS